MAATNRPEVLDPAVASAGPLRPPGGYPLPNQAERTAILLVHSRDKHLGPGVDLTAVALGTPGFSGADLANLANEAAIVAVRNYRDVITDADLGTAW